MVMDKTKIPPTNVTKHPPMSIRFRLLPAEKILRGSINRRDGIAEFFFFFTPFFDSACCDAKTLRDVQIKIHTT